MTEGSAVVKTTRNGLSLGFFEPLPCNSASGYVGGILLKGIILNACIYDSFAGACPGTDTSRHHPGGAQSRQPQRRRRTRHSRTRRGAGRGRSRPQTGGSPAPHHRRPEDGLRPRPDDGTIDCPVQPVAGGNRDCEAGAHGFRGRQTGARIERVGTEDPAAGDQPRGSGGGEAKGGVRGLPGQGRHRTGRRQDRVRNGLSRVESGRAARRPKPPTR